MNRLLLALAAGGMLGFSLSAQTSEDPEESNEPAFELEALTVVGSRIEAVDLNTPSPVSYFSAAKLEEIGYATIGDFVRNLPINNGSTIGVEGAATGFSSGTSSINLRGLGNNNTLVLIDGRRSSPAGGSGFDGFQTVFDFNSVPTDLIESIQILKDAGSAVYGSDAVAGVVDIRLKEFYDGTTLQVSVGNSTEVNSPYVKGSLIHGFRSGHNAFISYFDYLYQGSTKYRDREFSHTGDQRWRGGYDLRSPTAYPARFSYFGTVYTAAEPTTVPMFFSDPESILEVDEEHPARYDFNQIEDMFPLARNWGFFFRWRRDDNATIKPFVDLSFRQNRKTYEAAPVAFRNTFEQGDGPGGVINIPAHNPYNPIGSFLGGDMNEDVRWRLTELGNRIFENESNYWRGVAGLKGTLSDARWETALVYARSDARYTTHNVATDADLQAALNGELPGFEGLYANPFGPSPSGMFDAMRMSNTNKGSFAMASWDGFISGRAFAVNDGAARYAIGYELRSEQFEDKKSALSAAGQILGGSEGAPFDASREVYAVYAEGSMPLGYKIEARVAGRAEYYSDFGWSTKPKISLAWHPFKRLTLRASFGQAFLAPNLPYLYTPQLTTFSDVLADPKRPGDPPSQIQVRTGGDPDLQPEETDVWSVGFLWRARPDGLGLSVESGWFEFKQTNLLRAFTASFLLANEDLFPELVVRSDPPVGSPPGTVGPIQYLNGTFLNIGKGLNRGYDLDIRYAFKWFDLGNVSVNFSMTYTNTLQFSNLPTDESDLDAGTGDFAGDYGNPRVRGSLGVSWNNGPWRASVYVNYKGAYQNQFETTSIDVDQRVTLSIGHNDVFGWDLSLGIRNLFNEDPPFDYVRAEGYNLTVNSGESRFVTLTATKDF